MRAPDAAPLAGEIRQRIERLGPLSVAEYMTLCLTHPDHGYYTSGAPIGGEGDFITAPEISQIFGELIGIWAIAAWRAMGSPENVRLVELGPGRGTMMADVLRATKVVPAFRAAIVLHLLEISPVFERLQRLTLAEPGVPLWWHPSLADVPDGPLIILANEFVDALPVRQAVMCADGWHERVVKLRDDGRLHFSIQRDPIPLFEELLPARLHAARIGQIFEWRSDELALEIGRRVVKSPGVALIVDYGHFKPAIGDTLQAVREHRYADPLEMPGRADLTAHVDFHSFARGAEAMGARVHGPLTQATFLRRLGIDQRAAVLKASAPAEYAGTIDEAVERLTNEDRTGMGSLIKAVAFSSPKLETLPGFDP